MRKYISLLLVVVLFMGQLIFPVRQSLAVTGTAVEDYEIIHSSTTWSESRTIDKPVIVGPNATLTISANTEIQLHGDLIIFGKVQNSGELFLNGNDVYANSVNMGGIQMTGDPDFPQYGVFSPYGYTTNVGTLSVDDPVAHPEVPIAEITSHINGDVVYGNSEAIEGKTIAGFEVTILDSNGQRHTSVAGEDGSFTINVPLEIGINSMPLYIKDVFSREYKVLDLSLEYQEKTIEVVGTTPAASSQDVAITSPITIEFDSEIKQGENFESIQLLDGNGESVGIEKTIEGNILTLTPNMLLNHLTQYKVVIPAGAINGVQGGMFGDYEIAFTTGEEALLEVVRSTPANGEAGVAVTTPITVEFDNEIQPGENFASIQLLDGNGESVSIEKTRAGTVLTLTPHMQLDHLTQYKVVIPAGGIEGLYGETLGVKEFTFTTAEEVLLEVVKATPANGEIGVPVSSPIKIEFNTEIQHGIYFENIGLLDVVGDRYFDVEKRVEGNTLIIEPIKLLNFDTEYKVIIPEGSITGEGAFAAFDSTFTTAVQELDKSAVALDNYEIIRTSTVLSENKTFTKPVIIAPYVDFTVQDNVEVQFQGDLIIYGYVKNNGKMDLNGNDVYANSVIDNGMRMTGDPNYSEIGVFSPLGNTVEVGDLIVAGGQHYPVPPVDIITPQSGYKVDEQWAYVSGKTISSHFRVTAVDQSGNEHHPYTNSESFTFELPLTEGMNTFKIFVTDVFNRKIELFDYQVEYKQDLLKVIETSPADQDKYASAEAPLTVKYNKDIKQGSSFAEIQLKDSAGNPVEVEKTIEGSTLTINPISDLANVSDYQLSIPEGSIVDSEGGAGNPFELSFTTLEKGTGVSGGVYTDTTWTKADSPYIVKSDVVVFPGKTLKIEPGVEMKFLPGAKMEVRGTLEARGTDTEKIIFSSMEKQTDRDWQGILVDTSLGGKAILEHSEVSHSVKGLWTAYSYYENYDSERRLLIKDSSFHHNNTGLQLNTYGSYEYPPLIENSIFASNQQGIDGSGHVEIKGSSFSDNQEAIREVSGSVWNSSFKNNITAIQWSNLAIFDNDFLNNETAINNANQKVMLNTFEGNETAIQSPSGSAFIGNNQLLSNTKGIVFTNGGSFTVKENKFLNTTWDAINETNSNLDLTENYWGDRSSSEISAKLKDGYDDVSKGLIEFEPVLDVAPSFVDEQAPYWGPSSRVYQMGGEDRARVIEWSSAYDNTAVSGYRVYLDGELIDTTMRSTYTLKGLEYGKKYSVKIEAGDRYGNWSTNGPSMELMVYDHQAPVWVEGSTVEVTDQGSTWAVINLPKATDNSAVDQYRIYTSTTYEDWHVSAEESIFKIEGLTPNVNTTITVHAIDAFGNISEPLIATVTLDDTDPPSWPADSGLTVSEIGESTARISWPSANDEAPVEYQIYVNDELIADNVIVYDHLIEGLDAVTSYNIKVKAKDSSGNPAADYLSADFVTKDFTMPNWPAEGSVTVEEQGATWATISWTPAQDNVGVHEYRIYKNGGPVYKTVTGDRTTFKVEGLIPSPGSPITIEVEAVDASGHATPGRLSTTVTLEDHNPPVWPGEAKISVSNLSEHSARLSWPLANDESMADYKILINDDTEGIYTAMATEFNIYELEPGTNYKVTVVAFDLFGNEATNNPSVEFTTPDFAKPYWPAGSSFFAQNVEETQLDLVWAEAWDNSGVTQYRIKKDGEIVGTAEPSARRLSIAGLSPGTEYEFTVEARDAAGNWSNPLSLLVTTLDKTSPTWPADAALNVSDVGESSVKLSWPEASDNSRIDHYVVKKNGTAVKTVDDTDRALLITGLDANREYTFSVEAVDGSNNHSGKLERIAKTVDITKPVWLAESYVTPTNTTDASVELRWYGAVDNDKISQYRIFQDGEVIETLDSSLTSFTVENLPFNREISFKIEAGDESGNWSTNGPAGIVNLTDNSAPEWEADSKVEVKEVSDSSVSVTWPEAIDNDKVEHYEVYQNEVKVTETSGTSFTTEELENGQTYSFKVIAIDPSGNHSAELQAELYVVKDTIAPEWQGTGSEGIVLMDHTETGLWFEWGQSIFTDNVSVKEYAIYVDGKIMKRVSGLSAGLTGLEPGHTYTIKVEALDPSGNESINGPEREFKTMGSSVKRVSGSTRYETAVDISKSGWEKADTVILARGDSFPDALAGAPLAYKLDAPILLTNSKQLSPATFSEIERLGAKNAILLGGRSALSKEVEDRLTGAGIKVERISGETRYETAVKIAEKLGGNSNKAVLVYGRNFPDALSSAAFAARNQYPILLTDQDKLPETTANYIAGKAKEEVFVVGGSAVVKDSVMKEIPSKKKTRFSGANRYDTAVKMMEYSQFPTSEVIIASGVNFADALTGSVLAAKKHAPLLLVNYDRLPLAVEQAIDKHNLTNFTILGGEAAVHSDIYKRLQ